MGENVLRDQVKKFKKGRDRALTEMSTFKLFNRPDIISTSYTAAPINGCAVSEGDELDAHLSADGQNIRLAKASVCVAQIECDGAIALLDALRQNGSPGLVPMKVAGVSAVSGFIKVVVSLNEGPQ